MYPHLLFSAVVAIVLSGLTACSSNPKDKDYRGYKNSPYIIKGKRYVPMRVEQALTYSATGIASHSN